MTGLDGGLPWWGLVVGGGVGEPFIPVGAPLRAVTGAVVGGFFFLLGVSEGANHTVASHLQPAAKGAHPWHWVDGGCRGLGSEGGPQVCVLCLPSRVSLGWLVRAHRLALEGGLVQALCSLTLVLYVEEVHVDQGSSLGS